MQGFRELTLFCDRPVYICIVICFVKNRYTPQTVELETKFRPFIPEYIPAGE